MGIWNHKPGNTEISISSFDEDYPEEVALVRLSGGDHHKERDARKKANARLIAAAPDMLYVINAFLMMPRENTALAERVREWVRGQARAAIAKATIPIA